MTGLALLIASGVVALLLSGATHAHRRRTLWSADQRLRQSEASELSDRGGDFIHNGADAPITERNHGA